MSSGLSRVGERPPALDTSLAPPSSNYNNNGLSAPLTPMTPMSPSAKRKTNPLQDLMETEKIYVDRLTGIIRKVASAWSRSNLPPPELDKMFRGIEAIYKSNRSLLAKLNELGGADPAMADPKALGDLLMKWIDDLTTPYSNYCNKFMSGFDMWSPVQSNSRLPSTLATFSATHPPPLPAGSDPHPSEPPLWSLDALFILPRNRLKYYRKLYGRLLKSTTEGRSDYRLLVDAVDKLDTLMRTLDERSSVDVASIAPPPPVEMEDEVVMDMRQARESSTAQIVSPNTIPSPRASSASSGGRPSNDGRFQASARTSTGTISMPISDLERRLATDRCIDIFTMKPKSVRLQITPPSLAHTRELLLSADVTISVTPRVTGVEVVHGKGHIYILSDLFLIGERMTAEERAAWPAGGPDTWLCYPPLAGKHLRLSDSKNPSNSFQITIMKKETFTVVTESLDMKELAMAKFKECIAAAANLAAAAKAREAPPMPSLDGMIRPSPAVSPVPSTSQVGSSVGTPVSERALSPATSVTSPLSFNPERRFSPPSQAPSQYEGRTSRSSSLHSGPPGRGSLQGDYPPSDLPALPTGPSHMGAQLPLPPPPPPEKPAWDQRMSDDMMAPPPRAPFAAPDRPGSAPLPNNQMPPNFQQGPPQGFGPGQMYNQLGMGNGGPGGGRPPGPPGPGGMGPPPPHMQHPGPYGHPQMRNATMPSDPRFQGQPPGPGMYASGSLGGPPVPPHADHGMRRAASSGALATQFERASLNGPRPPMPPMQGGGPPGGLYAPQARMLLPSALQDRVVSSVGASNPDADDDNSPPTSPRMSAETPTGPVTSTIIEQGKCKIFHQQHHQAWKSLGSAHLQLFHMQPTNVKQLVVQADDKKRSLIISTIVLSDGVERVGKTGIAVSLSDKGVRTGIVYMVQLKNESAANQLFDKLILGSDRRLR